APPPVATPIPEAAPAPVVVTTPVQRPAVKEARQPGSRPAVMPIGAWREGVAAGTYPASIRKTPARASTVQQEVSAPAAPAPAPVAELIPFRPKIEKAKPANARPAVMPAAEFFARFGKQTKNKRPATGVNARAATPSSPIPAEPAIARATHPGAPTLPGR